MSEAAKRVTACVVIIGNEILSGRTTDANLPHIAKQLGEVGISLAEARIVPDIEAEIIDTVNTVRAKHDYVFTTGGIGPTHDDITSTCIAKAFGLDMERNAEAERRLLAHYPSDRVTPARMKMAEMPVGAALIDNPVSIAPGFRIDNVYVLAGVPKIMQAMLDVLKPNLKGGDVVHSRTLVVFRGEGDMAAVLTEIQNSYPQTDIGSYPFFRMNSPGTAIVFRSADTVAIDQAFAELEQHCQANVIQSHEEATSL